MEPKSVDELAPAEEEAFSSIILEEDPIAESQLGPRRYLNKTPESRISPRDLVTEQESFRGHFLFNIRSSSPVFGHWKLSKRLLDGRETVPACQVILEAAFTTVLTNRKYKSAKINVEFQDGAIADLDPDDDANESAIEEALQFQPKILAFAPQKWWGPEEVRDGEIKVEGQLNAPPPVGTPSFTLGYTKPVVVTGRTQIDGILRGTTSSEVQWSLQQNTLKNSGIISRFSMPIIVQYTPRRPFVARVRVVAEVEWGFPFGKIGAGKLDDPIRFDPEKLGATEDTELSRDLNDLCNLKHYEGSFVA
jgi:hypothetical protein